MADEAAEKKQQEEAAAAEGKKEARSGGNNRMMFFIVLGVVIVLNAVIAIVLVQITMPKPEKKIDAIEQDSTQLVKEEITEIAFSDPPIEAVVNIKGEGTDAMRFLKIALVFAYDGKKYKDLGKILTERHPELKNLVIDRLASRSLEDLQRPNARDEIRAELKRYVNKSLPKPKKTMFGKKDIGHIADVYINEFIIQ